jgi:alkylmercury lyase-like protein
MASIACRTHTIADVDDADIEVRNSTYRRFVELGRAPTAAEVAAATGQGEGDIRDAWRRLHAAHALVLDAAGSIRMANPFSGVPTPFLVEADDRAWFANCGWDALGIGAALHVDSTIETSCPDCLEPIRIDVHDGRPTREDLVFHVLVPAATWWDDIGYT